jgi:undecaprenyl-phosphate galactose phosphotransferase
MEAGLASPPAPELFPAAGLAHIGAVPAHTVARRSLYRSRGKRIFDLALGALMFVSCLPLMLAVGTLVLLTSGWPVLYASERVGLDGRRFWMWKFRTMVHDADIVMERWKRTHPDLAAQYATNYKLKDDPRVTRLGRFLRKSSLDELPQFWNVLRGDMSLVGPRPYLPALPPDARSLDVIFSVRPAISGPFQVNGRNALTPRQRMQLDVDYALHMSFLGDCWLLLQTFRPIAKRDGD